MIRFAVSLPPSSEASELVTINSGIVAVSAEDASAIERSNPATFWKRLTTRSRNSGRSQNVSFRTTRSRFMRPRRNREREVGSGCRGALVLPVHDDAVHDVDAQGEDRERPPRVVSADRQQGTDGTEPGARYAQHPPVGVAGQ